MKQIITAKLKLNTTLEENAILRKTQLAYRDGLNFVSQWSFANGKTSNQDKLQKACYDKLRSLYGLPAQMACNIPRQVGATYKVLWTKAKQSAAHLRAGLTKKRYKGLDKAPKYIAPTLTYNIGRDYSFKTEQRVSILSLDGRIVVHYEGYHPHLALIKSGATIGAAKLWYDKPHKQFYLLVSLEVERPDAQPIDHKTVIGVDVGQRYLAVATNMAQASRFFPGGKVIAKANHYVRLRKRLQKKGTRSATRRLIAISGRERRFKLDTNHTIAKQIIDRYPNAIIGLEELTGIRERTKRNHSEKATKQQRKANRRQATWGFAELHGLLAYKAMLNNCMTLKVDANYTSKACPRCGHTDDQNRPSKGLMFDCQNCGFTLHSDLVGARNIALRTLLVRQDWTSTGVLSLRPDVSDKEAKAARLQRYAELRWSPDTSSRP
jgi:putative transposase